MSADAAISAARLSNAALAELFYRMALIRCFEERVLERFGAKELSGTTHTYIGQEATAVAALAFLQTCDFVCSQHRSHGYFLASGGDARALFLEMLGDADGVCRGLGGSQHLYTENFLSNGVLGGTPGIATGIALAEKLCGGSGIVVSFMGDGTLGEGLSYESFNIASLRGVPILFVVENNRYAQTTRVEDALAGSLRARIEAFGIVVDEIESNDVLTLSERFSVAFAHVRAGNGPFCQIVHTYRLGPHSKGDDFRPDSERHQWQGRDPLILAERHLGAAAAAIRARADAAAAAATAMPEHIDAAQLESLADDRALLPARFEPHDGLRSEGAGEWMVIHLQRMFAALLVEHNDIYLLGEDIRDPYGGAFKVYRGLSEAYSGRILGMPVSEAGMVAAANGLALRGLRPIVEIMFGDFATLAFDQILNHATKFARMYADKVHCPIILRMPMGGYRGYGPTHSQSIEKFFLGVPGLVVTASDLIHDPRLIWERMLALNGPALHVENKTLYGAELPSLANGHWGPFRLSSSRGYFPTTTLTLAGPEQPIDLVICAYGGMVEMAMRAALTLFEESEIVCDVVVPSQLAPLPAKDLASAVARAAGVIVLEEGTERAGFGAELLASLACAGALRGKKTARCAARDTIIPNSLDLERAVLPSVSRLVGVALELYA